MSWKTLDLEVEDGVLPPLLVKAEFTVNSYAICISDLTFLWQEDLDRRSIIKRSLDENTSIDPSEDANQMRQFLDKLKLAVDGGHGTSLKLESKGSAKADGQAVEKLILVITADLPAGFEPLVWPVHLSLKQQTKYTESLTIPLLKSQDFQLQELNALVEILKDKDHVIQKTVDKIEAMGVDLGLIFAGASKRGGKATREWQEERVKGLKAFDLGTWRQERVHEFETDMVHEVSQVVPELFTTGSGSSSLKTAGVSSENWWEKLEDLTKSNKERKSKGEAAAKTVLPPQDETQRDEDDDDFQVQSTPPHLMGADGRHKTPTKDVAKSTDEDSTEDEDDLDEGSQPSRIADSYQHPKHTKPVVKHTSLNLQRRRKTPSPIDDSPRVQRESFVISPNGDSETEDENEGPHLAKESTTTSKMPQKKGGLGMIGGKKAASQTKQASASPPPLPKSKKGGLGNIGGRKKDPTPAPEPSQEEVVLTDRKSVSKLGLIGGRSVRPEENSPNRVSSSSMTVAGDGMTDVKKEEIEPKDPEPEKTAEEKANKKREELKRQLEEKAKIPAKKKRKF